MVLVPVKKRRRFHKNFVAWYYLNNKKILPPQIFHNFQDVVIASIVKWAVVQKEGEWDRLTWNYDTEHAEAAPWWDTGKKLIINYNFLPTFLAYPVTGMMGSFSQAWHTLEHKTCTWAQSFFRFSFSIFVSCQTGELQFLQLTCS